VAFMTSKNNTKGKDGKRISRRGLRGGEKKGQDRTGCESKKGGDGVKGRKRGPKKIKRRV